MKLKKKRLLKGQCHCKCIEIFSIITFIAFRRSEMCFSFQRPVFKFMIFFIKCTRTYHTPQLLYKDASDWHKILNWKSGLFLDWHTLTKFLSWELLQHPNNRWIASFSSLCFISEMRIFQTFLVEFDYSNPSN